ncbi:hypothetical protein M082_2747 [Bacteroides fragilis str. 3725 D9 ii]|nr:hypothetical protein M082_2747 [Bacteroides fragilis str. 3725 D9 ii]DAP21209.1 MAG TPA: hypothetical protein [Caudoviricetes sp.]
MINHSNLEYENIFLNLPAVLLDKNPHNNWHISLSSLI